MQEKYCLFLKSEERKLEIPTDPETALVILS